MGGIGCGDGHLGPPTRLPIRRVEVGQNVRRHPAIVGFSPGLDMEAREYGDVGGMGAAEDM